MRDSYDVAAIGGGPDALVAAAGLADAGHSVLVVGERGQPGGVAANVPIAPGFQFPVFRRPCRRWTPRSRWISTSGVTASNSWLPIRC